MAVIIDLIEFFIIVEEYGEEIETLPAIRVPLYPDFVNIRANSFVNIIFTFNFAMFDVEKYRRM